MAILVLEPIFKKRIWGSRYFKEQLNYPLDDDDYGELWSISAHSEGLTKVINGKYVDQTLDYIYKTNQNLFGTSDEVFPLMVKLIQTNDKLSVQVHPDNIYAKAKENSLGKTECWYFLDAKPDANIVLGHFAKSYDEMEKAIKNGKCEDLLIYNNILPYDFTLIPSKTVHALGKGLLLLEIQQSSDLTYRLYDYNRRDKNGNLRELHVQKGLDVIDFPQENLPSITNHNNDLEFDLLTDCEFFSVYKWNINDKSTFKMNGKTFAMFTVANGNFKIDGINRSLGESFILTKDEKELTIKGNGTILISIPK